jgi:glucokinase
MNIGVDIGGTHVRLLLVEADGEVVDRRRFPAQRGQAMAVLDGIAVQVERWRNARHEIEYLGVACAGWVDATRRLVHVAPNLGWKHVAVADVLERRCMVPVRVDNDVNAALLGEIAAGAARGERTCVAVFIGTGIGGAIVVDGALVRGRQGAAAEVGHCCLDPDGPLCSCGRRGCWEAFSGGEGLLRRAQAAIECGATTTLADVSPLTTAAIVAAAQAGDTVAASLWDEALRRSVQAIANLAVLLDPGVVVVGGGVAAANPGMVGVLRTRLAEGPRFAGLSHLRLVTAELGDDAGCLGMALGGG